MYSLPGGSLELGERVVEGAAREMREELGVSPPALSVLDAFTTTDVLYRDKEGRIQFHYTLAQVLASLPARMAAAAGAVEGGQLILPALAAGDDAAEAVWCRINGSEESDIDADSTDSAGSAGSSRSQRVRVSARAEGGTRVTSMAALQAEGVLIPTTPEVLALAVNSWGIRGVQLMPTG